MSSLEKVLLVSAAPQDSLVSSKLWKETHTHTNKMLLAAVMIRPDHMQIHTLSAHTHTHAQTHKLRALVEKCVLVSVVC